MLVQDDCSPFHKVLASLCDQYGAQFSTNLARFPRFKGDIPAIVHGMVWATGQRADLLVKMSRRFVPTVAWAEELRSLAMHSQYATYSAWTSTLNFGFRTECVGFAIKQWKRLGLLDALIDLIHQPERFLVERAVHGLARRAAALNSLAAEAYDAQIGKRPRDRDGYAPWPFMGTDRAAPTGNYLWHDWAKPRDYARLAIDWGLPYAEADFADPNIGCGQSPRFSPAA